MAEDTAKLIVSILVGSFISLATVISLSPQTISFLRFKTSRGISFYTLWIGFSTSFFVLMNSLVLNFDWTLIELNSVFNGTYNRILNLINQIVVFIQLAVLTIMYLINVSLFVSFTFRDVKKATYGIEITNNNYEEETEVIDYEYESTFNVESESRIKTSHKKYALLYFFIYLISLIILGILSLFCFIYLSLLGQDRYINTLAHVLGYSASVIIFVQWLPQILKTFLAKSPGNFSIVMMLLLCPGAFINVIYLSATGQSISTWLSYLVSGLQQIVLLILLVYYSIKEKLAKRKKLMNNESNDNFEYKSSTYGT